MTWVRLDDQFADNPKLERAGPLAAWISVAALCYSAEHLLDGVIPQSKVARLTSVTSPARHVQALIREGVWHEPGHDCARCGPVPEGHYVIHDYLDYQRSRADVEADREREREKKRRQRDRGSTNRAPDGTFTTGVPWDVPTGQPEGNQGGVPPYPTRPDLTDLRTQPTNVGTRPHPDGWQDDDVDQLPDDQPTSSDPDAPTDSPDMNDLLTAAARHVAETEMLRRQAAGELTNPDGYRRSRIGPIRREHEPYWRQLIADNPQVTAHELAAAVTARGPRPGSAEPTRPAIPEIADVVHPGAFRPPPTAALAEARRTLEHPRQEPT